MGCIPFIFIRSPISQMVMSKMTMVRDSMPFKTLIVAESALLISFSFATKLTVFVMTASNVSGIEVILKTSRKKKINKKKLCSSTCHILSFFRF